ncbi:probable glycosyltransferase At3g07620 [Primulina huaijiensis]|uniref:probable glycosyltransferase At3g07620 n=1 Tax=Primulina huaijiensis TaxID=1492673 RepID=UPI003CC6EDEC
MDARRLLWLMALAFSVVLLVQYFELPYGYLSYLLSFGKSQVVYRGNLPTRGSSSEFKSVENQALLSGSNSSTMSVVREDLNAKKFSSGNDADGKHNLSADINNYSNETSSLGDGSPSEDFLKMNEPKVDVIPIQNKTLAPEKRRDYSYDLPVSNHTRSNSSLNHLLSGNVIPPSAPSSYSAAPFKSPESVTANHSTNIKSINPDTSSMGKDAPKLYVKTDDAGLTLNNLSSTIFSSPIKKERLKGPPAKVLPISAMNDLLLQSYLVYLPMKPNWPSKVDQQLHKAKTLIENAQIRKGDPHVYRNYSAFLRSYELMEKTLKIYIYTEGEQPIFHQPALTGIYASEGWFMKQLEENKHFVTKNADQAHLFYLPFSSWMLEKALYVPDSHSSKNLVQYLSSYLQNITTTYRFWNRTDGADHFLVACHDWAPFETSRIMANCIRALCNADAKGRFLFGKDVSLPETNVRMSENPLKDLGGKPPSERHILAFFAGRMHGYLRPILLSHWENKDPDMKISGKLDKVKGQMSYSKYMKSSKYCISAKGYEAYTPRVVEAIFYECVPVIISDNYVPPFFETLNWESFAVFILEKDIPNLKKILLSIPEKRYIEMQQRVKQVQTHFLWHETPIKYDIFHMILHSIWHTRVFQMRPG